MELSLGMHVLKLILIWDSLESHFIQHSNGNCSVGVEQCVNGLKIPSNNRHNGQ